MKRGKTPNKREVQNILLGGKLQTIEEEESGEIGGLTTPTYPPKPHLTFSIVFLREFF